MARFLQKEGPSLFILFIYTGLLTGILAYWRPSREWLGIQHPLDVFFCAIALLWVFLLLIWAHQQVQAHLLQWLPVFLTLPLWIAPYFLMLAGSILYSLIFFVIALLFTPIGITARLIGFVYQGWQSLRGIHFTCPRDAYRMKRPSYLCPGACGEKYSALEPSIYGIFSHNCTCGAKLPTLNILGRRKLVPCCRNCGATLTNNPTPLGERVIVIIGGTSVGKTNYLMMSVREMLESLSGRDSFRVEIDTDEARAYYDAQLKILRRGKMLRPTQSGVPTSFPVILNSSKADFRLHFYDAAGEEFVRMVRKGGAQGKDFVFFRYLNGVILMVDPLSLPKAREEILPKLGTGLEYLKNSTDPLEDVVSTLVERTHRFLRSHGIRQRSVNLAVVINKCDVGPVNERIGQKAIQALRRSNTKVVSDREAENILCREALFDWGAGPQIRVLEHYFEKIAYFSCSALGRSPSYMGRGMFKPDRVLSPLFWILGLDYSRGS